MAENNMFELKIISPEEMFYEGEGSFLEFTSVGGEMGVYKNHIPLTTILEPCVMKIHKGTEEKSSCTWWFCRNFAGEDYSACRGRTVARGD